MRKLIPFILLLTTLVCGCKQSKSVDPELEGQFSIAFSDGQVIDQNKIEFYDFSASLVYLKPGVSFISDEKGGTFNVLANDKKIYSGTIHTSYSSYFPLNVFIIGSPSFYGKNIIHIDFGWLTDQPKQDPRDDSRIIEALKKNNQYRAGLSCDLLTLTKNSSGLVTLQLQLKNNDAEDLYYLDHEKMGIGPFHYFTNGLNLLNSANQRYKPDIQAQAPTPAASWRPEWLSLMKAGESKVIELRYDFGDISNGTYKAVFQYPGLHHVERKDLYQNNARIWLGDLDISKTVSFN